MRFDIYSSDSINIILGMGNENLHTTLPKPGDLIQLRGRTRANCSFHYIGIDIGIVISTTYHLTSIGRWIAMVKVMWAEE